MKTPTRTEFAAKIVKNATVTGCTRKEKASQVAREANANSSFQGIIPPGQPHKD